MLVKELVKNINFNDSYVNKIEFSNEAVIMNIDLCMWKQRGYKEGNPELVKADVVFSNITNYYWYSNKSEEEIDCDTIIEIKAEDDKIKIILEDEKVLEVSEVSILSFECKEAQLNYIIT